ncbi:MAG: hypothetical protein OXC62_12415 [Aestuariivita sp.]|nr:hypothetical protein [Aestuariivita sp.]
MNQEFESLESKSELHLSEDERRRDKERSQVMGLDSEIESIVHSEIRRFFKFEPSLTLRTGDIATGVLTFDMDGMRRDFALSAYKCEAYRRIWNHFGLSNLAQSPKRKSSLIKSPFLLKVLQFSPNPILSL